MKKIATGIVAAIIANGAFAEISAEVISVEQGKDYGVAVLNANYLPVGCSDDFYLRNDRIADVVLAALELNLPVQVSVEQMAWAHDVYSFSGASGGLPAPGPWCAITSAKISK